MAEKHEKRFLEALRDIFVGAEIEGEGGFINLMRIKSRYYTEGVGPKLLDLIAEELKPFPEFREELFDKLYTFFKRYFSESGSIYFRHTAFKEDIYEKIYTDDRDVMLFWKTQNLYYVKTDRLFRSMKVSLDADAPTDFWFDADAVAKQTFDFDASSLETKKNNEKRGLIFEYKGRRNTSDTLEFRVLYAEGAKKTKTAEIVAAVRKDGLSVTEEQLNKAFRLFERQTEVDFFINKNARAFLTEQCDLWLYQYLFKHETEFREKRIRQLQVLKKVAYSIIDFISQFEDELVRIWNKPKFVRASGYIITFDRIRERSEDLARRFVNHEGFVQQVREWKALGITATEIEGEELFADKELQYLPFDTAYFKSLEIDLISLFDDLDENLDGRLIHSENYQALRTIGEKFRERARAIYIDPPYNTNLSEIDYVNDYKGAAWLSMVNDRLEAAKKVFNDETVLCVTIDDYEAHELVMLLDEKFNRANQLGIAVVRINPSGRSTVKGFSVCHEYAMFYGGSERATLQRFPRTEKQLERFTEEETGVYVDWRNFRKDGGAVTHRINRPKQFYPIYVDEGKLTIRIPALQWDSDERSWTPMEAANANEVILYPIDEKGRDRVWSLNHISAERNQHLLEVRNTKNGIQLFRKHTPSAGVLPRSWFDKKSYAAREYGSSALVDLFGESPFAFAKSPYAVQDCIWAAGLNSDTDAEGEEPISRRLVLDFFAGSGTTAHAVLALNREDLGERTYMLVEANEYFTSVVVPRVKKLVFSDRWKEGKAQSGGRGISHFCKYFSLEQYEDTLRRAVYINDGRDTPVMFDDPYKTPFSTYVFLRDPKMSNALEIDFDSNQVRVDFEKLYDDIDWAETLSCVKGKFISRQTSDSVTFHDGETVRFDEIDYNDILPLIWWDK